jgi:hypothetical protein
VVRGKVRMKVVRVKVVREKVVKSLRVMSVKGGKDEVQGLEMRRIICCCFRHTVGCQKLCTSKRQSWHCWPEVYGILVLLALLLVPAWMLLLEQMLMQVEREKPLLLL